MPRWLQGTLVALAGFASLGTVSALWPNPLFMRMTPAGAWEIGLLGALALLGGLYVGLRRPACADRTAGAGGIIGFLGIACPTCNKLLMLLFGGELLLTYFEPVRLYLAAAGTAVLALAVFLELRRRRAIVRGHLPAAPAA